ncbi:hypothetical protein DY000_02049513 [Brassica cretica]|uniref:SWIM-type domain-containing protein n=1 Tax=Brassica cretica TaxID=69181 RepID=A0ABQ7EQG1_BRACR|nr:hypothetical protein DY000_02049513 [Brassica cretica]
MYHRVDLDKKTCSCKQFDSLAISCAHAVAASKYGREPVESRVDVLYSNAYWALAYSRSIKPMTGAFKRCRTCSRCGGTDHNKVTYMGRPSFVMM